MSVGLDPSAFWHLTMREVSAVLQGAGQRIERERQSSLSLAWHIAALQRQKRLPRHDALVRPGKRAPSRQSADDMVAIAMQWHQAVTSKRAAG